MYKIKNLFMIICSIAVVLVNLSPSMEALAVEDSDLPEPILRVENERIGDGYFTNLNENVDDLKSLDEGTIIVRFRNTGSSIMSLFSLSNSDVRDGHFHMYVTPTTLGSENRLEKPDTAKENIHVHSNAKLEVGAVHTVAMVVDKDKGYKYFVDGELIMEDTQSPVKFLSNIYQPDSAQLGRTDRAAGSNEYPFSGDIDFAEVYNQPLNDQVLLDITGETDQEKKLNPLPEDALITEPDSVFYPGFMDSNNYRIPALLYTEDNTLIAGIDRRVNHGGDSPANIDAAVRRSFDQGDTWEEDGIIVNNYPDQASNIDLTLLQDKTNERIFALVDGFPQGGGFWSAKKGSGFKTIDGEKYMLLTDEDGNEFTIRDNGVVYDASNNPTDYSVDQKRNLYLNDEKIDNVFSATTPLKAYLTSYLELYYSDDEGETWTGPIDLNDEVKEEWMSFLGTGPGNGIQLTQGPNKGRLVMPVYFLNDAGKQASAVVYSDDHGETWHRGESPNEGRDVGNGQTINEKDFSNSSYEITEAQVVEMPDGQLKMFMRNFSGYARIATSFDGGETWHSEVVVEEDLVAPYSQMSAIRYNGQIDGKEAVIFSSAGNSSQRINGKVRVGLIEEDGTYENGETKYAFDWKYEQLVKEGHYGYSSLTNLENGEIGLFYEATGNTNMDFIKFNPEFLKWKKYKDNEKPNLVSFEVTDNDKSLYKSGDTIKVEAQFDDYVMLMGEKQLVGTIGDKTIAFDLVEQNGSFVFEGTVPELEDNQYDMNVAFANQLDIYSVKGESFEKDSESSTIDTTIGIGVSPNSVEIDQSNVNLVEGGKTIQLSTSVNPIDATILDLQWESTNTDVATVDEDGIVTSVNPGTATIKVTANGEFTDEITVTVEALDVTALETIITTAENISNADGSYTEESFQALQTAIADAKSAVESIETEEDVTNAVAALQGAIDGLEEASEQDSDDNTDENGDSSNTEDENENSSNTEDENGENQEQSSNGDDNELPNTATPMYNWMLIGLLLITIASGLLLYRRKTLLNRN
ncbi:Sialidase A precursor [Paraliobacillus sp. PM-2]|uniref:sialidase domain-containing protein n=1 Tax=Paraliobacillus sp. PM-2 TaxID=1462524 RepID=UPI00061BB434|nr:sialidase domain-containing protein [Paraliobacillus sp. PM-2]CQR47247.1 Sialidase A precursor [Paraliobacillus sp. PM-2]